MTKATFIGPALTAYYLLNVEDFYTVLSSQLILCTLFYRQNAGDLNCYRGESLAPEVYRLHLVNDERLLENSRDCISECTLPDGNFLRVTTVGSVLRDVIVAGKPRTVRSVDVYLAPFITRNMGSWNIRGSNSYLWIVFNH
uniref:AlNc14C87G5538 protein n=1 Tax=Albugo laibachii Nc14 TaxID=890382 RepID=F0WG06_9STRA|nr:AlNc14C87G5538 [Albugo laibachii Nc14]|eukprot:CCA20140.1 AlNc14C87G5538 [Albugo laibachii Nc14]